MASFALWLVFLLSIFRRSKSFHNASCSSVFVQLCCLSHFCIWPRLNNSAGPGRRTRSICFLFFSFLFERAKAAGEREATSAIPQREEDPFFSSIKRSHVVSDMFGWSLGRKVRHPQPDGRGGRADTEPMFHRRSPGNPFDCALRSGGGRATWAPLIRGILPAHAFSVSPSPSLSCCALVSDL